LDDDDAVTKVVEVAVAGRGKDDDGRLKDRQACANRLMALC
jgi:hypothetical protein